MRLGICGGGLEESVTAPEIDTATALLIDHASRIEPSASGSGQALSVYWNEGGVTLFRELREVEAWIKGRETTSEECDHQSDSTAAL